MRLRREKVGPRGLETPSLRHETLRPPRGTALIFRIYPSRAAADWCIISLQTAATQPTITEHHMGLRAQIVRPTREEIWRIEPESAPICRGCAGQGRQGACAAREWNRHRTLRSCSRARPGSVIHRISSTVRAPDGFSRFTIDRKGLLSEPRKAAWYARTSEIATPAFDQGIHHQGDNEATVRAQLPRRFAWRT